MKPKIKLVSLAGVGIALALLIGTANAGVGMGVRAGTLGYGMDVDFALLEKLNLRVGYSALSLSREIDDTDIVYDGNLKLSNFSALVDWHPFASGFRLSLGATGPGLKIDVTGKPSNGFYDFGNNTYTSGQIGSVRGELKMGKSASPYIGLGWGNVPSKKHRVTFLFDLGAVYSGTPSVNLTAVANCSGLSTSQCTALNTRLQGDVALETAELKDSVTEVKWWPVLSLGLGVRFK